MAAVVRLIEGAERPVIKFSIHEVEDNLSYVVVIVVFFAPHSPAAA